MGEHKPRFTYLYILLAALWLYCFFVSVIRPPFLAYYTFDETFITDSGVFLWYGITPRILDWPASPSVLMYGVLFGISIAYHVLMHLSELTGFLDAFVVMDRTAYGYLFDREGYILVGRALRLLIVLVMMFRTLRFLFRSEHRLLAGPGGLLTGLVIVSTHLVWVNGVVLRPEAISAVFFIHILCRLLFSERLEKGEVLTLSVFFALVVAERLIFMFMAPLFFAGIFLLSGVGKWKGLKLSLGVFVISFMAFCPFVLTDPLIISKAFFGGILAKVNDSPMTSFFNWDFIGTYFDSPAGYLALALTFLGLYRIWREKNVFYRIVAGNWLFFLFLVLRSAKIYDPHVLPGALVNLLLMGLGLGVLAEVAGAKRQYILWIAGLLIVAGEVTAVVRYHSWVRRDTNRNEAVRWIQKELPDGSRILSNIDIGLHLPPGDQSLDRRIAATENKENQLNKLRYLMGLNSMSEKRLSEAGMPLSASAFAFEDEALFSLQYQLLRRYGSSDKRKRFEVDIYMEDVTLLYHGVLLPRGMEDFRRGKYDYLVTEEAQEGLPLYKEFTSSGDGSVWIYKAPPVLKDE